MFNLPEELQYAQRDSDGISVIDMESVFNLGKTGKVDLRIIDLPEGDALIATVPAGSSFNDDEALEFYGFTKKGEQGKGPGAQTWDPQAGTWKPYDAKNSHPPLHGEDGSIRYWNAELGDYGPPVMRGRKESNMSDKKAVTEANTDSQHTPGPAIWRNQLVQVRKKNTNEQVDSGLVTMVDGEKVCIGENEYPKDQYSFMVLA